MAGATAEVVGTERRATTDWMGCTTVEDVVAGSAVVYVRPTSDDGLLPTHSGDARWRRDATPVTVTAGETTELAVRLPWGDTSYGSDPELPVAGVRGCVSVEDPAPPGIAVTLTTDQGTARTGVDEDGCFRFTNLLPGHGRLEVLAPAGSGLRGVTGDGRRLVEPVADVEIEPDRWNWNASLPRLARVTRLQGRVTDQLGNPIPRAVVAIVPADEVRYSGGEYTDADGRWDVLVRSGQYRIAVDPPNSSFQARSYGGAEFSPLLGEARPPGAVVDARPGEDLSGLDVALTRRVGFGGRVVDEAGRPIAGAGAVAYAGTSGETFAGSGNAPDGRYLVSVLPGTVRVYVSAKDHLGRWYGGDGTVAGATPVDARPDMQTDGYDVVLQRGGAISGTVVDTLGRPVPQVQVSVEHETAAQAALTARPGGLSPDGKPWPVATVITDARGAWDSGHTVPSGRYVVKVNGRIDSDWVPTTCGGDVGLAPQIVTVRQPDTRRGVAIMMRHVGEPVLVSTKPVRPVVGSVTLPIDCPLGCRVDLRRAASRHADLLGRGRSTHATKRVRLRLTRVGRRTVGRRAVRATARVRPSKGPARTFKLRLRRARR